MAKEIIWLHEKALSLPQLEALGASEQSPALFVWDDAYFRSRGYTLKRLVFIYETLCALPVEIVLGETLAVLQQREPEIITTFFSADTRIAAMIEQLARVQRVEVIRPRPFVDIAEDYQFQRFFKYWNKAKKTAFLINGGEADA